MTKERYRKGCMDAFIQGVVIAVFVMLWAQQCKAENNNMAGELHIQGFLLVGACHLEMQSLFQEVNLGNISKGILQKPGDAGEPVHFSLRFRNCDRTGGRQINRYTGVTSWDETHPVVSVSFLAPTEPNTVHLIAVQGIKGIALMINDNTGRQIVPGIAGVPHFLTPADNALNYTVKVVRTSAPLETGDFRAVADFKVSYN
ncbi:fimbrial protein [Enterobacter wuhouensis]|uniref:fimbrial protein n=1 Tax=Enterobacter wuhouensis TaxID=2529381 RepID=UPI003523D06B